MKKYTVMACTALLAVAAASTLHADEPKTESFQGAGITLTYAPSYEEAKGTILPYGGTEIGSGSGIYESGLLYIAMDRERYEDIAAGDTPSDEETDLIQNRYGVLLSIISADNGMSIEDVNDYAGGVLDTTYASVIATSDDCTHYLYDDPESVLPEDVDAVYREEFDALKADTAALLAASEFGTPVSLTDSMLGRSIHFETTDTEGNPVKSEELFGAHEITMVNIWASWCGPCVNELAELEEINGRLAEKDCAIVGLLYDGNDETGLSDGRNTLGEKGVTYTNILPPDDVDSLFYIPAFPTTYFVNREGTVVGRPVIGADVSQYEKVIDELLSESASDGSAGSEGTSGQDPAETAMPAAAENGDSVYRVITTDADGNPVAGAMVQLCSDEACLVEATDENGTAIFSQEKGSYTVHILTTPEGFEKDDTEYALLNDYCDLTVVLKEAV